MASHWVESEAHRNNDNIGCFTHGWHIERGKNSLHDIPVLFVGSPSWPWWTPNIGIGMFDMGVSVTMRKSILWRMSPEYSYHLLTCVNRDVLPSIKHLELDKLKTERIDHQRYPMMATSAPLGSPATSTIYSGPPPPYSSAVSTAGPTPGMSGYISPPHSTRRSTRDEKDSPVLPAKSLPSIHEALGDNRSLPFSSPTAVVPPPQQSHHSLSAPNTAVGQTFPDAPKGPSNPFSQPVPHPSNAREVPFNSQSSAPTVHYDSQPPRSSFPMINTSEPVPHTSQNHGYPLSPRHAPGHTPSQYSNGYDNIPAQSPHTYPTPRSSYQFSSGSYPPPSRTYQQSEPAHFEHVKHLGDHRTSFSKDPPYADNVKRELDVFDAETALKEITESSSRTLEFSRVWSQRSYQSPRNSIYTEFLPGITEVEEMMQHSERVRLGLSRIMDVVIAQQNALSEQRLRAARGPYDEYHSMDGDYRGHGGFAGGDAKKRRGVSSCL